MSLSSLRQKQKRLKSFLGKISKSGERRERHGQGARGAADPPGEQTGRKALRGGRLRGRSPRAGGIGVLRARQGVVHRGPR